MPFQTTIQQTVEVAGVGLHTAVPGHLRLCPAPADTGIVFRRTDLDNFPIKAHVGNVARVSYATSLMKKGVLISTTEHLLAALYSCGVDNCFVDLDAIEVPILDGSAQPFIEMLGRAGVRTLRRRRRYLRVVKPLEFTDAGRRIGIYPADEFRVQCFIDFPHPAIGRQHVDLRVNRDTFSHLLAPARTFGFEKDFEGMRKMGLIRGGSYENALVLSDEAVMNGPLRFADEFGRHKTLDLIGDLALVGRPLRALVVAHRAGHALHTQLVTRLLADSSLWTETVEEAPVAHPRRAAAVAAPASAD
ncbi:MAG TPA: UDP-3-O-acyl-N-acetylglucosamine deacetylase [Candidatus Acidoferrales bacterium]|nr:UDP-3-O-acyl-N-acetylglucosamine deacetylase [Candidatus Acidoferrales bacterium]